MRGISSEREYLTPEERERRLRRIKAMIDSGCDTAQVVERYGVSLDVARRLALEARALPRHQATR